MGHTAETRKRALKTLKERRSSWLVENGPCQSCGTWSNLEVDHINPEEKVSHRVWSWSAPRRAAELAKCQVLCGGCHLEKTKRWHADRTEHGSHVMYVKYKCRCDKCVTAKRSKKNEWRQKRRDSGLNYT